MNKFNIPLAGIVLGSLLLVQPSATAAGLTFSYVRSFDIPDFGTGQFIIPSGVAVDGTGNLYVADTYNGRIVSFNPSDFAGTFTSFGTPGYGTGQFSFPSGVAVDSTGNVYVSNANSNRIVSFNPSDFAGTFTSFGIGRGTGQFISPFGVAVDSIGNVYVANGVVYFSNDVIPFNYQIMSFNPSDFAGTFTNFGTQGRGIGQFTYPSGVAVDSTGNIYVADTFNARIVSFNPSDFAGTFTSFGGNGPGFWGSGSGIGQFFYPSGIAVDSTGNVYVADTYNSRIVSFNPSDFLGTFSSFGTKGSGTGHFSNPFGVAVDSAGNVYVADTGDVNVANPGNKRIVQLKVSAPAPTSVPESRNWIGLLSLALGGFWLKKRSSVQS